jgi:hypothetical protein
VVEQKIKRAVGHAMVGTGADVNALDDHNSLDADCRTDDGDPGRRRGSPGAGGHIDYIGADRRPASDSRLRDRPRARMRDDGLVARFGAEPVSVSDRWAYERDG